LVKIDKVLFCLDSNPSYTGYWYWNSRVFKQKLGLDPVLLYVGTQESLDALKLSTEFGEVRQTDSDSDLIHYPDRNWKPSAGLLWGACQFSDDEVVLICGIDNVPLSDHLLKMIEGPADDAMHAICLGPKWSGNYPYPYYTTAYATAKSRIWKKVVNPTPTFPEYIRRIYHEDYKLLYEQAKEGDRWGIDEAILTYAIAKKVVPVMDIPPWWSSDQFERRQDRMAFGTGQITKVDEKAIRSGCFSELHGRRPLPELETKIIQCYLDSPVASVTGLNSDHHGQIVSS